MVAFKPFQESKDEMQHLGSRLLDCGSGDVRNAPQDRFQIFRIVKRLDFPGAAAAYNSERSARGQIYRNWKPDLTSMVHDLRPGTGSVRLGNGLESDGITLDQGAEEDIRQNTDD